MRLAASCAGLAALAVLGATTATGATGFRSSVAPIGAARQATMTGRSWHPGCPVALSQLRVVTLTYWGFDRRIHTGVIVVNTDATRAVVSVFRRLYAARFPLRLVRPVDAYGGSDFRSIEADNTSSFNCRAATGSSHWSEHAYGRAIDINPIENPYVENGRTSHIASRLYLDRSTHRPGMAYPGGVLVQAFASAGWGWGGNWSGSVRDYQHFSVSGR
jgi:D-alanyl-D-alanine carboxypeptidase